jgi:hypothetical protein
MKSAKFGLLLMLVLLVLLMAVPMVYAAPEGKGKGGNGSIEESTSSGELELAPIEYTDGIKCFKNLCWAIE